MINVPQVVGVVLSRVPCHIPIEYGFENFGKEHPHLRHEGHSRAVIQFRTISLKARESHFHRPLDSVAELSNLVIGRA